MTNKMKIKTQLLVPHCFINFSSFQLLKRHNTNLPNMLMCMEERVHRETRHPQYWPYLGKSNNQPNNPNLAIQGSAGVLIPTD